MNVESWLATRFYAETGCITLIEYVQLGNKEYEPRFIGFAPLDSPEDAERWRIAIFYYAPTTHKLIKIRDLARQHKWTERAALV